jgi:septum formation protein
MVISDASPLVLGSASPRRREILQSVRVPHVVIPASIDEAVHVEEVADAYLERIVAAKLAAVRAVAPSDRVVLVADTSVILDGEILGKPSSIDDAEGTIRRLSGRTHEVHTRFAVACPGRAEAAHAETVVTRVTFRALSPREARAYAESGEGLDKAGAYAVQGLGASLVPRVDGSYTNVVGLPACEVVVALTRLGLLRA